MASNTTQLGLGALAAVVVGAAVILLAPTPEPAQPDVVAATAPADAQPTAVDSAEPEPEEVADAPVQAPSFDTFRVEPDGNALIAGRAEPGQVVDIVVGGASIMQATADSGGSFVAMFTMAASDDARTLRLIGDPDGTQVASAETIMVAPFGTDDVAPDAPVVAEAEAAPVEDPVAEIAAAEPVEVPAPAEEIAVAAVTPEEAPVAPVVEEVAVVADDTVPDAPELAAADMPIEDVPTEVAPAEEVPAEVATADVADIAQDSVADTRPQTRPTTPTTLIADADGVRVLAGPEVMDAVALDTITYDPAGEVLLAGRAQADGFVRVYIDNKPVTTSRISAQGDWRTDLPQVDTGVYTLRIDEVADDGTVMSRIETPFKREEPAAVAAVMAEDTAQPGFEVAVRTVQPGSTLWAIAQEEMGDGIMYVAVFEANRDLIKDPDMIFPGQVFRIPEATQ